MLEIVGRPYQSCDKVSRRTLLRVGGLGLAGFTLPDLLRQRAVGAETNRRKTSVILLWQGGGPSHIDMFDLKPQAAQEFRGEFNPIATNVAGLQVGELLTGHARIMDKFAVVRSVTHTNAGHGMGSQWMQTGRQPTIEVNDNIFPSCGSIVSKMRGANAPGLPAYVNLPRPAPYGQSAYLGAAYNPFDPGDDPNSDGFQVRNVRRPGRVSVDRLENRRALLSDLDNLRRDADANGVVSGLDSFYRDAMEMVTTQEALKAFDVHQEDPRLRDRYGRHTWGQSCLLARRLVEAGATYVTVDTGGWDTHSNNFSGLKTNLLPKFDQCFTALVEDIYDRGLENDVLVMAMGEFGRTPQINKDAGRDHWPGAMSVVFAGGGMKMGQMIGTTTARAEYPASRPCSPGDVLSTMYRFMGIDHTHVFYDAAQRPLAILPEGRPIDELFA